MLFFPILGILILFGKALSAKTLILYIWAIGMNFILIVAYFFQPEIFQYLMQYLLKESLKGFPFY